MRRRDDLHAERQEFMLSDGRRQGSVGGGGGPQDYRLCLPTQGGGGLASLPVATRSACPMPTTAHAVPLHPNPSNISPTIGTK